MRPPLSRRNLGLPFQPSAARPREPLRVRDASTQDERVVVEAEVRGIQEQHLADLQRLGGEAVDGKIDARLFGRAPHHLGEIKEALARREVVRPQDDLAFEVLALVERQAVSVSARLDIRMHRARPIRFDAFWRRRFGCTLLGIASSSATRAGRRIGTAGVSPEPFSVIIRKCRSPRLWSVHDGSITTHRRGLDRGVRSRT
jgi:hypothetical protein